MNISLRAFSAFENVFQTRVSRILHASWCWKHKENSLCHLVHLEPLHLLGLRAHHDLLQHLDLSPRPKKGFHIGQGHAVRGAGVQCPVILPCLQQVPLKCGSLVGVGP